jgi:GTP cyclohydrolase I
MSTRTVLQEGTAAAEARAAAALTTEELYRELLRRIGEDTMRDGLAETPERVEKAMAFLTQGYAMDVATVLNEALFEVEYDEMVMVRDIEFYSLCEHHLLPFFGKVHVAYVPSGRVIGLSKIPRLVEMYSRRLQVQERLTTQIADAIVEAIAPQGVGVIVEKQHSATVTSAMRGVFKTQMQTRNEFLSLVRHGGDEI